MGYVEDIQRMPEMYDYSIGFFNRYYRPENCVLMITGDIDPKKTMDMARKYYSPWKQGYVQPKIPVEPEQTKEKRIDVAYEGKSLPIVWLAYKSPAFDPANRDMVASVLLADLAFGETSDLHKKLVLDEQVCEFIEAEQNLNRDPTLFDIVARVKDPEKVDYVLAELERTVGQFQSTPVTAERLADVKSRGKYGFLMGLETPSQVASAMARFVALTGGTECVDQMYAMYEQIAPQDVQKAAKSFLTQNRRTVAVLRGGQS
jgi:zinc protease